MTKWQYETISVGIRRYGSLGVRDTSEPAEIWERKMKSGKWAGKTAWNQINSYGEDGWELVSVTPITENSAGASFTTYLLYTFKKPAD